MVAVKRPPTSGSAVTSRSDQPAVPTAPDVSHPTTVLAAEYDLDSKLVTAIVFISTLLSPFTLTPLLVFLGE